MKTIALVSHFFVHYRLPVLRALADSKETSYYFLGDTEQTDDIKRINFDSEPLLKSKFIPLKNKRVFRHFFWQKGLLKQLKSGKFDAVIFLGDIRFLSTWIALILLRLRGKKTFLWTHGLYGNENWIHLQIKLLFTRLSHGVFLYNNRAKHLYQQRGINEKKLTPIYNSLNFEETEQNRILYRDSIKENLMKSFQNPGLPVVFCIGRLNKIKKIPLLVEAISVLKNNNFDINCFIIGSGEDKKAIEDLASHLNIRGQIYFTGALYKETEISGYIMSADLCVCPGAIGLTAIHALSYGVPALTHNNFAEQGPEHEAIIPGKTGNFYKESDVQDLANKIQETINQRLSDKEESIQNCIAVIQQYYNPMYQKNTINQHILSAIRE